MRSPARILALVLLAPVAAPAATWHGLMGGEGQGCGSISVEAASWGAVKAAYR